MSDNNNAIASAIRYAVYSFSQLTLIVLKLTHVTDWPWWAILLPTLIPLGVVLCVLIAIGFIYISTR